jgi:L-lactate dehydrogenase
MSVRRICEAIVRDEKSVLPISSVQHGANDIYDVALSMPAIIGANGVETKVPLNLDDEEKENLIASANGLKDVLKKVGLC